MRGNEDMVPERVRCVLYLAKHVFFQTSYWFIILSVRVWLNLAYFSFIVAFWLTTWSHTCAVSLSGRCTGAFVSIWYSFVCVRTCINMLRTSFIARTQHSRWADSVNAKSSTVCAASLNRTYVVLFSLLYFSFGFSISGAQSNCMCLALIRTSICTGILLMAGSSLLDSFLTPISAMWLIE